MEERWIERSSQSNCLERLKFCHVDFTMSPLPYEDGLFDLILDKSTLDCTLCSDNATASLLVEVYRCLAVGGSYLLISFHEHGLLLPLLDSLPGAQWDITHTTMQRHVEDISRINDITRTQKSSSAPLQSGTDSKPLNVFIAKKVSGGGNHLDFDSVCRHVHECNDRWFQINQPLLTRARTDALKKAFASPLDLRSAYQELFTDSEKEHLTYDSFLEDWDAFLLLSKDAELPKDSISSNTALEFLEKMHDEALSSCLQRFLNARIGRDIDRIDFMSMPNTIAQQLALQSPQYRQESELDFA
eukprot:scaffold26556_cov181-Cylindrotheca_fusiformis.AAC.2